MKKKKKCYQCSVHMRDPVCKSFYRLLKTAPGNTVVCLPKLVLAHDENAGATDVNFVNNKETVDV